MGETRNGSGLAMTLIHMLVRAQGGVPSFVDGRSAQGRRVLRCRGLLAINRAHCCCVDAVCWRWWTLPS